MFVNLNTSANNKLRINNSLCKGELVPFVTKSRDITWYTCGITAYGPAHLGHAKNYVNFDVIRRIFEHYFGYNIHMVMNVTDIDDKIINRAIEENVNWKTLAEKWEKEFFEDMATLNVNPPNTLTRVSEYIEEIKNFIDTLIELNLAYTSNGSVYFDVAKFKLTNNYGKLSCENDSVGANNSHIDDKKAPMDFALWKATKSLNEPFWESKWGNGRPGWHIECSAMASSVFGSEIDIHTGGEDLKFPHHCNELAQSEGFHQTQSWVNYFLHSGHLGISGSKMSKSLKNFITVKEALKKNTPRQLRMLFLLHNYDTVMEYSKETLAYAVSIDNSMEKLLEVMTLAHSKLQLSDSQKFQPEFHEKLVKLRNKVDASLSDNFNTPKTIKIMLSFGSTIHKYLSEGPTYFMLKDVIDFYNKILNIFGLNYGVSTNISSDSQFEQAIDILVDYRSKVRASAKNKDIASIFELSDTVRDQALPEINIKLVDDHYGGSQWIRK
jgi:cysteinyl-tRNA synthetase